MVQHLCQIFRQRWPRLFACYVWPERYRTNNAVETFFGRLRTRQRQIHGRKSVHEFIIRYGEWAIYLDVTESFEQVLERFQKFQQADFDTEYARFLKTQQRLQTQYRFRHHPRRCLTALENQWAEAIRRKAPRCQGSRHREQFISEKAHDIVNTCYRSIYRIRIVHALSHKERVWTTAMNSNAGERRSVYG